MGISLNIGTEDAERLTGFYRKLWGDPLFEGGGYASWQMGESLVTVGPHDQVKGPNVDPGRFLLSVMSSDIKADFERYRSEGATVVREVYQDKDAPQFWIATFSDPDGNYLQIVQQV